MPIFVCGISHNTATVALREQVIFASEKLPLYLQDLAANEGVKEVVILSTCNRSEVYCHANTKDQIIDWFCRQHALARDIIESILYIHEDYAAVEHVMRVACGLDSMVLGESQILGQLKTAFSESCAAGTVGSLFHQLFQDVFSVAKAVRTHTAIGACPVSIASSAMSLVKQNVSSLQSSTVLLLGAGDTIHLVMRYLQALNPLRIILVNRSMENAMQLAEQYQVEAMAFSELPSAIQEADILISATGSTRPLVTFDMLAKKSSPIFIVDIAVPRDVEESASALPFVQLKTVDDLVSVIQQNRHNREHAAEKAHQMIAEKTQAFMTWRRGFNEVANTIRTYRNHIEALCAVELSKAKKQLARGENAVEVLESFAYALTNKLLHYPSVQLRQAGINGRFDLLELTRELFALSETKSELI